MARVLRKKTKGDDSSKIKIMVRGHVPIEEEFSIYPGDTIRNGEQLTAGEIVGNSLYLEDNAVIESVGVFSPHPCCCGDRGDPCLRKVEWALEGKLYCGTHLLTVLDDAEVLPSKHESGVFHELRLDATIPQDIWPTNPVEEG